MSDVRQELADAASSVDGVTCTPTYRQISRLGQACVRLERIDYPDPFGSVRNWNVVVCLGTDMAIAETFIENNVTPLVEALKPFLAIRSATPQQLRLTDSTTVLALFINGIREE